MNGRGCTSVWDFWSRSYSKSPQRCNEHESFFYNVRLPWSFFCLLFSTQLQVQKEAVSHWCLPVLVWRISVPLPSSSAMVPAAPATTLPTSTVSGWPQSSRTNSSSRVLARRRWREISTGHASVAVKSAWRSCSLCRCTAGDCN